MEEDIILNYKNGIRTIIFNRPERKNALCVSMYETITRVLNEDAADDKIIVTIITGSGSYFTSGNDFKDNSLAYSHHDKLVIVKNVINSIINYPKLLIAVINGPAIGIGATMAGLCDVVYATSNAIFDTPFVKFGLCAEGASSFTFPFILGRSKASEVLLLNHKLSAEEAYQFGLVSKVIPQSSLNIFLNDLQKYGDIPVQSLKINKGLMMANFKSILHECNNKEIEQLLHSIESEEFSNGLMKFLSKNSKL